MTVAVRRHDFVARDLPSHRLKDVADQGGGPEMAVKTIVRGLVDEHPGQQFPQAELETAESEDLVEGLEPAAETDLSDSPE